VSRSVERFDTQRAIAEAWKLLWADNLKKRAEGQDFRGDTTYLTASDVVEQVRTFAQEQLDGKAWGATGRCWGRAYATVRISTSGRGGLLGVVRSWLELECRRGRLEIFTFGRGHISGARYRPAGEGVTETETTTMRAKQRRRETPRPIHYAVRGEWGLGRAVCLPPRRQFSYGRRGMRPRVTNDRKEVTCPRCRKQQAGA
jgi:hypothetical protein